MCQTRVDPYVALVCQLSPNDYLRVERVIPFV